MRKVFVMAVVLAAVASVAVFGEESAAAVEGGAQPPAWKFIGAAVAVGLACLGGGIAVGQIGAAAMGAMAEKPELSGKALPFVGLAEGICLWGFLVALIILLL